MKTTIKTQSKSIASIVAASLIAVGGLVSGTTVHAADAPEYLTKTVAYADLNLDSEQGARILYARLRSAAQQVCYPEAGRDLQSTHIWRQCYAKAMASAVADVNKATVTALYTGAVSHSPTG